MSLAVAAPIQAVAAADEAERDAQVLAELSLEELLQVQVTTLATGTPRPIALAPSVVTVLTAADIEAMGATTVEEALEAVPGLHVSVSGPFYRPRYLIRGIASRNNAQVLLMVDGVPITSVVRGGRGLLSNVPIAMISRIEVMRGPGSAVWGADALTGAINIVTKSADEAAGIEAGAFGGSYTTASGWLMHGSKHGDLQLTLGASAFTTLGHRRTVEADAARGMPSTLAPGPVNVSRNDVSVLLDLSSGPWRLYGLYQNDWNEGTGSGVANALDPVGREQHGRGVLALSFDDVTSIAGWEVHARASYYNEAQQVDENLVLFPPGSNLGGGVFPDGIIGGPEYWEQRLLADASVVYRGAADHRLRLGGGYSFANVYRVQETKNYGPGFVPLPGLTDVSGTPADWEPTTKRHGANALLQEEWQFAHDWDLTLGARFDYSTAYGASFSPRAGLVFRPLSNLTARLFYGRAFRAPAEVELMGRNNPATTGNPSLSPELIDTVEANVEYATGSLIRASISGFYFHLDGLVDFIPDAATQTNIARNAGELHGAGFSVEAASRPVPELELAASYSYQGIDGDAPEAPAHKFYGRAVLRPFENWQLTPGVVVIGSRARRSNDPRAPLDGYASLDLVLRRTHLYGFDLSVYVKNVFDADLREPAQGPAIGSTRPPIPGDLPLAGRSFYGELSYRF